MGTRTSKKTIAKVRTPHGTRVARRITCSACGASDTIDFAPRDPKTVLCRRCAFERYGALDADDSAARTRREPCSECGRSFDFVHDPKQSSPFVCSDCRAGIQTQQADRSKKAVRVSAKVVRARRKSADADET